MSLKVEVLEQSFEEIKPQANEFVGSFYNNLFTANPETKPLFEHTDMASQKKMLLNSLVMVIENLRKPDVLDKALRGLGARHVKYGALPAHYPLVGSALLTTFQQYLGDKWTPNVKEAWVGAYGAISEIMLDGANYSPGEIALKSKSTSESIKESSNTEIAATVAQPIDNSRSTDTPVTNDVSVVDTNEASDEVYSHNSGKATVAALAGGGIMGIIATILAMLI